MVEMEIAEVEIPLVGRFPSGRPKTAVTMMKPKPRDKSASGTGLSHCFFRRIGFSQRFASCCEERPSGCSDGWESTGRTRLLRSIFYQPTPEQLARPNDLRESSSAGSCAIYTKCN